MSKIAINLFLCFCLFLSVELHAQWHYPCNDTLTYHNHQNGELMIHPTSNQLYSMQKQVVGNQFRLDVLDDEIWSPIVSGTSGLDFVVMENELYVLRKVANQFVLENYDLSGNLNWSSTSSMPLLSAQFFNAELLVSSDSVYVHFIDSGYTNGGSVLLFQNSTWADLNAGRFEKVVLNNFHEPVGLKVSTQSGPPSIHFTFKKFNSTGLLWDSLCTVSSNGYYAMSDFIISENDSIYLSTFSSNYSGGIIPNLKFYAIKESVIVQKQGILGLVNEYLLSARLIEERMGDILLYYSFRELGPWSAPAALRWKPATNTWVGFSGISPIINPLNSEFHEQMCLFHDVAVDSSNTYYVDYSFHTDFFMSNGPDSVHSHIRQLNNCSFLNHQNVIDTLEGDLVSVLPDYYQFQWLDCSDGSALQDGVDQVFPIPGNGSYALVVSNAECTDTSECLVVAGLGTNENSKDDFLIFPNPAQEYVFISDLNSEAVITVIDVFGKSIAMYDGKYGEVLIETKSWESGTYIIQIDTREYSIRKAFIKK